MTPERWREVKTALGDALELQGEERARFLSRVGAADPDLLREVQELLAGDLAAAAFTGRVLSAAAEAAAPVSEVGAQIGPYRLEAELGRGGMGTVYRARRADGQYESRVAVKLANPDLDARRVAERFRRERQVLAALEHPFIARLLDGGVTADGRLYLVMECVDGQALDAFCASRALGLEDRLRLFRKVCAAVDYAHRHMIVHRDLKPSNVLVAADGTPKLVDFGIAKLLDADFEARGLTQEQGRFLTPAYASPEHRAGAPVSTASDVYSLGVLLHEVLAGCLPRASGTSGELEALSESARGGPVEPRRLRGDLDLIAATALRFAPEERYRSVAALDEDLRRFLQREPVLARAPSAAYRARRFAQRHALAVGMSAALALSLASGGILFALEAHRTAQAKTAAARRGELLEKMLKSANPAGGRRDVTVAEVLDAAAAQLASDPREDPAVASSLFALLAETNEGLGRYAEALDASDRALALLRRQGADGRSTADALMTRGDVLRNLGRLPEAQASLREALGLLENSAGAAAARAQGYDLLGIALKQAGREDEAEAAYRRAIALYSEVRGDEGAKRAYPLGNLAVLLGEKGRYAESAELGAQALAAARETLPADHPDRLAFEMNYAGSLMGLHKAAEAEPLMRHVAEARARVLGALHKETLHTQVNLADCLFELQRYAEAAALARPAAESLEKLLGLDHAITLLAWNQFGSAACRADQAAEGLAALRRVEAARAKLYGPGAWQVSSTGVGLGTCLLATGQTQEAEAKLSESVAGLERSRGPAFHRTQAGYQALKELYTRLGREDEASAWGAKLTP